MRREPVTSSLLRSVGYEDGVLEVELVDGNVYRYFMVPRRVHTDLLAADSHGAFFNAEIRDRFPFDHLDG